MSTSEIRIWRVEAAEWAKFLAGATALATCLTLGPNFVFHGPLGVWQLFGGIAGLSVPAVLLGRRLLGTTPVLRAEPGTAWKMRVLPWADLAVGAATLSALLIAVLLVGAKVAGTTHREVPAEVVSYSDSGIRNKNCNVHATLRILSRQPKVCLEGMLDNVELVTGQTVHAQVRTVPYGFLIDALALPESR
jgi:hypothetical protein